MDVGKMENKEKMNVNKKEKTGLVLEGGGLRGIFTAGVLDFFLEKDFCFYYIILRDMIRIRRIMIGNSYPKSKSSWTVKNSSLGLNKSVVFGFYPFLLETDMRRSSSLISKELCIGA